MLKLEYRHSASKGNTFIDCPPFWIIHELFDQINSDNVVNKLLYYAFYSHRDLFKVLFNLLDTNAVIFMAHTIVTLQA